MEGGREGGREGRQQLLPGPSGCAGPGLSRPCWWRGGERCPDVRSCSWECFAFLFLAAVRWLPARRKEQPLPKKKKEGGEREREEEKNTL